MLEAGALSLSITNQRIAACDDTGKAHFQWSNSIKNKLGKKTQLINSLSRFMCLLWKFQLQISRGFDFMYGLQLAYLLTLSFHLLKMQFHF